MANLVFEAEEHALGVSGDDPIEVSFCAVGDPDIQFASGVVEGAIDATVGLYRTVHQCSHVLLVAYVGVHEHAVTTRLFNELNGLVPTLLFDVGYDDLGACACKRYRRGTTDAAGSTSDDHHLVLEGDHVYHPYLPTPNSVLSTQWPKMG